MSKIKYIEARFNVAALQVIQTANAIITQYDAQGLSLTLRQLYYQFVARDLLPNKQKEYKKLGDIISRARRAGLIDWEAIEDRTRFLRGRVQFESPADALEKARRRYCIDLWENQEYRVEVWIEKDALIGVIEGICGQLDVDFFSCRGYTSDSEAWRASQRFINYYNAGQRGIIFHLGDHDPSGVDMTREIQQRMDMFLGARAPEVRRIALTMDQVDEHEPPPNPAKITDPRATKYIEEHGGESWELDALEPTIMRDLIDNEVRNFMDENKWNERKQQELSERALMGEVASNWGAVSKFLDKLREKKKKKG